METTELDQEIERATQDTGVSSCRGPPTSGHFSLMAQFREALNKSNNTNTQSSTSSANPDTSSNGKFTSPEWWVRCLSSKIRVDKSPLWHLSLPEPPLVLITAVFVLAKNFLRMITALFGLAKACCYICVVFSSQKPFPAWLVCDVKLFSSISILNFPPLRFQLLVVLFQLELGLLPCSFPNSGALQSSLIQSTWFLISLFMTLECLSCSTFSTIL